MPYAGPDLTVGVASLMADIEAGETGDQGKAREWLARGLRAARDPAWTADGLVSAEWEPTSPVTGKLDAFEWKVPVTSNARPLPLPVGSNEAAEDFPKSAPVLPLAPAENQQ